MKMLDLSILALGAFLLVLWVVSANRPKMREVLLERYHFAAIYDWVLFLAVLIQGWDLVTHSSYAVAAFITVGFLGLGELAIRKEAGTR
jgi:hypothetical protein